MAEFLNDREQQEIDEDTIISFVMEDSAGAETSYELIGSFAIGEREYLAAVPEGGRLDGDIRIFGFHGDEEGRVVVDNLTDPEEYRRAAEVFEEIFNAPEAGEETDPEEDGEQNSEDMDEEDYCYEDADGNLFIYDTDGKIVYLDENGEEIR